MAAQKRGGASARVDSGTGEVTTGLDRMPSDDTTPTSRARSKELVELVRRTLEPREIEVWTAIELEGLDSAELAKRLGTTPSAARGVLFRAQRKLVQALGAELDGGETRSSHQPT
jgi:DNA-directed RNA polymerase specialized sigma24 family protein